MPVVFMFCEKCGKELPEDSKFCLDCGQPVTWGKPEEKPQRKSRKKFWLLGIASVLFVAGLLIAVFFADIAAWVERQVLSPELLLKKALASVAQDAGLDETASGFSADAPRRYKLGLYLDKDIQSLLSVMVEGDSTWITDLNLQLVAGKSSGLGRTRLSLANDETPIISLDVIQNAENAWIGLPELNERYLRVSKKDINPEQSYVNENQFQTSRELAEIARPYFAILFDSIHRVTKKNTSLAVEGARQNVLQLTATIKREDLCRAFSEMAERLKDDESARKLLYEIAQQDIHAEVVRKLEEFAAKTDIEFQLIVYLDKFNKPIGFEIRDGEGKSLLYYAKVTEKGKYASRLTLHGIELSGNGTTSGGKDTGVCRLRVDGRTVLTYKLKDFRINRNGFAGSLFFPLDGILPESSGLPDAQMGLELAQKTVDGEEVLSVGFLVEEKMLAGVLFSSEKIKDFSVEIPDTIVPANEMDKVGKWMESFNWGIITKNLTDAGVPVNALESLIG